MLVQRLDGENGALRKQVQEYKQTVSKLTLDLQHEKEAATRGPTAAAKESMSRLRQQLNEKEEELQVRSSAAC